MKGKSLTIAAKGVSLQGCFTASHNQKRVDQILAANRDGCKGSWGGHRPDVVLKGLAQYSDKAQCFDKAQR